MRIIKSIHTLQWFGFFVLLMSTNIYGEQRTPDVKELKALSTQFCEDLLKSLTSTGQFGGELERLAKESPIEADVAPDGSFLVLCRLNKNVRTEMRKDVDPEHPPKTLNRTVIDPGGFSFMIFATNRLTPMQNTKILDLRSLSPGFKLAYYFKQGPPDAAASQQREAFGMEPANRLDYPAI